MDDESATSVPEATKGLQKVLAEEFIAMEHATTIIVSHVPPQKILVIIDEDNH